MSDGRRLRVQEPLIQAVCGEPGVRLSIIVPVLDEAALAYAQLRLMAPLRRCGVEVIAVDGGSVDDTAAIARRFASRVIRVPDSRARQINVAAAFACGEVLLIMDHGVVLPALADQLIEQAMYDSGAEWGWLDVRLSGGLLRRLQSVWLSWRSPWQLTDQHPLFVSRSVFLATGGVPEGARCAPSALSGQYRAAGLRSVHIRRPALVGRAPHGRGGTER